jgi:hypothetical protein
MPVYPQFLQARAAEHRNRLRSYVPFAEPIRLPLVSGRVVSVPQMHLTAQAMIDLELVGNPFLVGGQPSRWDAYRMLWRLHPAYSRRGGSLARLRLSILCARLLWPACAILLRQRLDVVYQDQLATEEGPDRSPAAPQHCMYDDLCRLFASNYGLSREAVLAAPVAWLLQILRSEALVGPEGELDVIDPSDSLLGAPSAS